MARNFFINYRQSLNSKDAQLLESHLERHFPRSRIFLDVARLEGGDNWLQKLERQVDKSSVVIVLIGEDWADQKDEKGQRRLEDFNDFVRFEIARAISRHIPILPILVDGAQMPEVEQLPTNLLPIVSAQAMLLRSETFGADADAIAQRLKSLVTAIPTNSRGTPYWLAGSAALGTLMLGIWFGPWALHSATLGVLREYFSRPAPKEAPPQEAHPPHTDSGDRTLDGHLWCPARSAEEPRPTYYSASPSSVTTRKKSADVFDDIVATFPRIVVDQPKFILPAYDEITGSYLHRAYLGLFDDKKHAATLCEKLKPKYSTCWVTEVPKEITQCDSKKLVINSK